MTVIAMTRELGTLGNDIAEGLSRELGLRLVTHETVERLARKTRLHASAVLRCIEGKPTLLERWRADLGGLLLYAAEEILELAAAGDVVIRGWGATHLLRGAAHVLCVRVCAPLEVRASRVMQLLGFEDLEQARNEVRRRDAAREAAMRRRFGPCWEQSARYDLVLNTENMSARRCVARIGQALESAEYRPTRESRAYLRALALAAKARSALWRHPATAKFPILVEADMNGHPGNVELRGFVAYENQRRHAEDVVGGVEGVRAVSNNLRAMWPHFVM